MSSYDPNAPARGQPSDDAPTELGGYRLVELLGRGGMGEVWRAERGAVGGIRRRAAVKRILPRLRNDPALRQRFLAEARTNARLEHPNIVQVLDFGDQPEPYLVLEYVEGTTAADLLRDLARTHTKLPAIAAAFIAAEVATGLHYAHRKKDDDGRPLGIVHRDVSPQNVLVSLDGAVKISDFGVARAADNTFRTREGASVGKLVYMAPEQVAGEPFDARADVFALGITLWELLTVTPLLPRNDANAAMKQLLACDFPSPSQVDPHLPPMLDGLVMPALARNPADRYASAGAFAQAIRSFIHSIAPGFDSTELTRILSKLLPAVAFHSNTPPPREAAGAAPRAPTPSGPVSPPARSSSPSAPAAGIAAARAAQEMPVFHAPPGGYAAASAPAPAPSAGQGPPSQPAASAAPAHPVAASPAHGAARPMLPPTAVGVASMPSPPASGASGPYGAMPAAQASYAHGGAPFAPPYAPRAAPAGYATSPPDPNYSPVPRGTSRPIVIGVIVGLLALAIGGAIALVRGRGGPDSSPSSQSARPTGPLSAGPSTQLAPMVPWPSPNGASNGVVAPSPSPSPGVGGAADAGAASAPGGSRPAVPTNSAVRPGGGSSATGGEDPTARRPHTVAPARGTHGGGDTAAVIQRQLGGLRGMVRACLGMQDGSGARVTLTVVYDGASHSVVSVDTRGPGVIIGGSEARCVAETVRGAVQVAGAADSVTVEHEYEF